MAKLGEVFSLIRNGANIKQGDDNRGYPITRIETIANRTIDRNRMGYAGITDISKYESYVLQTGDILMSHINSVAHLGKVALYKKQKDETIIHGMNLLCLRPKQRIILPEFAYYYFSSGAFLRQLPSITKKSVNQASFNISALRELDFPNVDIEKQKSIVQILDSIQHLISLRVSQFEKLDQLVKSQFIEMFGDSDRNPYGIKKATWNTIFDTTTGKLDANAMVEDGQYPFFTCAKEEYKIDTYAFDCEALLLAGNNAAGVYDVKHYKGKFNAYQRTYVLQLKNESWSYLFFKHQLEQKLEFLKERSIGSNTRYLTKKILEEIEFLVPPVDAQHHYEMIAQQADKSKLAIQQSLEQLETLKKSLMQKYFG